MDRFASLNPVQNRRKSRPQIGREDRISRKSFPCRISSPNLESSSFLTPPVSRKSVPDSIRAEILSLSSHLSPHGSPVGLLSAGNSETAVLAPLPPISSPYDDTLEKDFHTIAGIVAQESAPFSPLSSFSSTSRDDSLLKNLNFTDSCSSSTDDLDANFRMSLDGGAPFNELEKSSSFSSPYSSVSRRFLETSTGCSPYSMEPDQKSSGRSRSLSPHPLRGVAPDALSKSCYAHEDTGESDSAKNSLRASRCSPFLLQGNPAILRSSGFAPLSSQSVGLSFNTGENNFHQCELTS